jgi:hypothetical protein
MRKLCVAVAILSLLLFCGALSLTSPRNDHTVVVSISTKHHQFALPKKSDDPLNDDWFEIEIDLVIRNNSPHAIVLCSTDAYLMFPQPYLIRMNQCAARTWSGDVLCAPRFTEENKIRIDPGHEYTGTLSWNCFMENYTEAPGIYSVSVRYSFDPKTSHSFGTDTNGLSAITTAWSNEVTVEINR